MTTCGPRFRSGISRNSKPASGRGGRNKNEVVEYGSMSLPQTHPVDQAPVPSAGEAIREQGGALRPWFSDCGKSVEPANRPEVGQSLRQPLNDPVFCCCTPGNQD